MLSKLLRVFTVILAVVPLALAGCSSGGGGGGGGDDEPTGPPTVTGYKYYMPSDDTLITRGSATNDWVATNQTTGVSYWGTYSILTAGIIKLVGTGTTDPGGLSPPTYAVEVVNGYLFMFDPADIGTAGAYGTMDVAFNPEGSCTTPTTQINYNMIKSGQKEWSLLTGRAFGTAAFTTPGAGLDLNAETFKIGETFVTGTPVAMNSTSTMSCAAGQGGSGDLSYLFTANGGGLLSEVVGVDKLDYVLTPEPASPVDGAALVASGVHFGGMYQQMVDQGAGLDWAAYLVRGDGNGTGIAVDSFTNPETGTVAGEPATLALGSLPAGANGSFDAATLTFNTDVTPAAVSVYSVGGKAVLIAIGEFDQDFDTVSDPEDWFFMILVQQ